jgi:hypothetical protein
MNNLPPELLTMVFEYCTDLETFLRLPEVSKYFRYLFHSRDTFPEIQQLETNIKRSISYVV